MELTPELQQRVIKGLKIYDETEVSNDYHGTEIVIIIEHPDGIRAKSIGQSDHLEGWLSYLERVPFKVEAVYTGIDTIRVVHKTGVNLCSSDPPVKITASELEQLLVIDGKQK